LSMSWDVDVDDNTRQIFLEFAAQGQSFFLSSGDNGSYAVGAQGAAPPIVNVASSAATIVGGTFLAMTAGGGAYVGETVWNSGGQGSGGGIVGGYAQPSFNVPIPSYQIPFAIPGNAAGASPTFRNVPDVSAVAAGILVWSPPNSCASGAGGTSYSTPLWAGF